MSENSTLTAERADLLAELGGARHFLRHTARDLTDEQAARRTTVSELTIGGLIKHVAGTEAHWAEFIVSGPSPADDFSARSLPDLDLAHPLPEAPWFPPGTRWTARRALLHVVAETAQHAGHADIIREALDGAKSMG